MTKAIRVGLLVGVAMLCMICVCVYTASGGGALPEGVEIFQLPEQGLTCVVWPDGSGECYCPCDECEVTYETPDPDPTSTGLPRTGTPVDTPVPPTDTPEPPVKCNSGRGNGSEGDPDCDPGNSGGHNQGGD